jgi:hypothetical protein
MSIHVDLKICEACGTLYYRAKDASSVYCAGCASMLRNFPTPESRKRRGRKAGSSTRALSYARPNNVGGTR